MHGRGSGEEEEDRKRRRRWHMWTGPSRGNLLVDGDVNPCSPASNSFCKDGREISVGDCALFKPPQDSPPFIGIIRWLTTGKENKLKLGVNWLYRPSEVKLGKGILLEAAPNEIFYSFHKDEIPAASLLHPCKVAFLPKGVEPPSGICSFVCRQVYDITNKCLWWLTDQDYINERQEEVDQLLHKTRIEMNATVQPGGRSPKPMNSPTSTSQLKPSSDSAQNSSSFPSQVKGKKRERGDQGSELVKRERFTKMDEGDSGQCRSESSWKSEVVQFAEKGGLVDSEGVEKLLQLMLPGRNEKKIDLVGRSMLAGVVAGTDKFDYLNSFVQLKGLPVFDEWLQDVHRGKIGNGSSPKENDKSTEEFLLILLRALDKLPVNLDALQMCHIGKSVNHLRTHKNLEIQKKARSLVDRWKKRVEAEMDAKSGTNQAVSWPAKPCVTEVSHGGIRHSSVSSEVAVKSLVAQPSSKAAVVKAGQVDAMTKSASIAPGTMKSAALPTSVGNSLKEQPRNPGASVAADSHFTTVRDEKSSSSSQSHNNSQSYSGEHAKTGGNSAKDDTRMSTAGSITGNKTASGSSRHRKSVNGFPGAALSDVQKEIGSSRSSSLHRNQGSDKLLQSSLETDRAADVAVAEGNNQKFVVKIPNRGCSPVQGGSGGSFEDASVMNSRASSPVLLEKNDQLYHNAKEKNDTYQLSVKKDVNNESWQSNDFKEVLTGSDGGDGSPDTVPEEKLYRNGNDTRKLAEMSKTASSSSRKEHKSGKLHEPSFSTIHALIDCISEANASMTVGDDVGMNLLANVAAGEMSKSDMVTPTASPQRNIPVVDDSCTASDSKARSPGYDPSQGRSQSAGVGNDECDKQGIASDTSLVKNAEEKTILISHEKPAGEPSLHSNSSSVDVQEPAEPCLESNVKSGERIIAASVVVHSTSNGEKTPNDGDKELEEKAGSTLSTEGSHAKENLSSSPIANEKAGASGVEAQSEAFEGSNPTMENESKHEKTMGEELNFIVQSEQAVIHPENAKGTDGEVLHISGSGKDMVSENVDELKDQKVHEIDWKCHSADKPKPGRGSNTGSATDPMGDCTEKRIHGNQVNDQHIGGPAPLKASPAVLAQESGLQMRPGGSMLTGTQADETEFTSAATDASSVPAAGGSDMDTKVEFDLNEGVNIDDGKYGVPNNFRTQGCCTAIHLISPLPLSASSVSSSLPASITVAAAAKGAFVPPEDLLKSRGELGWKGSAATSAFRPAEPRKALEIPGATTNLSNPDSTAANRSRPLFDFDLNVPDGRVFDDLAPQSSTQSTSSFSELRNDRDSQLDDLIASTSVRSSGGLDLDLNRVEEPTVMNNHISTNGCRPDVLVQPVKSSGGLPNGQLGICRDFDLNDGPLVDELSGEPSIFGQHTRSSAPSQPSVSGLWINNTEMGSFSSWFAQANPDPGVTFQSVLPDRGEQPFSRVATVGPQRMLAPSTVSSPFSPDFYRGPVLQYSPAMPFPSAQFQYPPLPFGSNFPLPSATFSSGSTTYMDSSSGGRLSFSPMPSQVLAAARAGPSHYPRPYVVSLPDGNNSSGAESIMKWGRQDLDLNAGPLGPDVEGRDETSSLAPRRLSIANSRALAEEQSRINQVPGGGIKRKEPEGGWEVYKQSSWH